MRSRIDEVRFSDLTPLGDCLRRHYGKGRYVHFSKQNKRLGVNTKAHHMDPKGVYFYPVDYLLDSHKFEKGDQWATNWPYWFIVDIDFSLPGLNLDTLTMAEVDALAERNGWRDLDLEVSKYSPWNIEKKDSVAKDTWQYLKAINQQGWTWAKTLRGLSWVKDSHGVIMSYEPEQVCVMNPRSMKLIETGQQDELHSGNDEKWIYWRRPITMVFNNMANKHGGQVVWKNKMPTLFVDGENWQFKVRFDEHWGGSRLVVETRMGRAEDRHTIEKLRHYEIYTLQEKLESMLEPCKNFDGNDMRFDSFMTEGQVKEWLASQFTTPLSLEWQISNSTHMMWGTHRSVAGHPAVSVECRVGVDDDDAWVKLDLRIANNLFVAINGVPLNELEDHFWKNLEVISNVREDFEEEGLWEKFLGWVAHYSGLKFLEPYEEKFLNGRDKGELYGQIQRSFRRVGW